MDSSDLSFTSRKPCFLQDNDADEDDNAFAGISGHHHHLLSRPHFSRSFRRLPSTTAASRSSRFDDLLHPHFLDSCSLCRKPLGDNSDIFMYRGDTPFCSEECREEQIEMDEAKEKRVRRASSMAMRKKEQQKSRTRSSTSPIKSSPPSDYSFRAGTLAAA